jgi:hypothetical protein
LRLDIFEFRSRVAPLPVSELSVGLNNFRNSVSACVESKVKH